MASIDNRSRFVVSVKNCAALTKHFPHNQLAAVQRYRDALRAQHYKPRIEQLDEHWLVRIRQAGYKPLEMTFASHSQAQEFVKGVEAERSRGVFIDYSKSHKATFAQLLLRYLREEAPRHKSKDLLAYKIEGWLQDSGAQGAQLLQQYRQELVSAGKPVRPAKFMMRAPSAQLSWLHKSLAEVTTTDIEDYIQERLNEVSAATADREIDILKGVFKVAIDVWDYNLVKNPMQAVRRPKYFNERDRRLSPGEEERLLAALAELDLARASEPILQAMAAQALHGRSFSSASQRKKVLAAVRLELRPAAEREADVVPYLQAFFIFQLMTGARRSETLGLTWERIDFERGTAYLPQTKNGRPRKLSLRADLLQLLADLPRDTASVFAVGVDYIVGAWAKALEACGIADLRIHDLRHEAISRVAEIGHFTIPELQQFSGHQDVRMLMRYAHLCASRLAKKLDESFKHEHKMRVHKGRKLLCRTSPVKVGQVTAAAPEAKPRQPRPQPRPQPQPQPQPVVARTPTDARVAPAPAGQRAYGANVIEFPARKGSLGPR